VRKGRRREGQTGHRARGDADRRGALHAHIRRPDCRAPPPSLTASTHRSSTSVADAPPPVSEKREGMGRPGLGWGLGLGTQVRF
jgi:hypothetical protein